MPPSAARSPGIPTRTPDLQRADEAPVLSWRVHLVRQEPRRLPALLAVLFVGVVCIWTIFGRPLPAMAAALLIIGAIGDFLFPVSYRITTRGVYADAPTSRMSLRWKEVRRCLPDPRGIVVSPLAVASRLDAFRGVTLRFAPHGSPGDRDSVLAAIAACAPDLDLTRVAGCASSPPTDNAADGKECG